MKKGQNHKFIIKFGAEDEKKIESLIGKGFKNRNDVVQEAVSRMLRKEFSKRTMKDAKIFSGIEKGLRIGMPMIGVKQDIIDVQHVKVGTIAEFQLFETEKQLAIIVDRDDYNWQIGWDISWEDYFCHEISFSSTKIKGKTYLIFYCMRESFNSPTDREKFNQRVKEKFLKAALEFRMKTIDGFLDNAVSFLFPIPAMEYP